MGNACCRSGNEAVVVETKECDNANFEKLESPRRTSAQDITVEKDRRQSDVTIWYDAMDRFPSDNDMSYPPTQSMRQLPIDFDMQEADSLQQLLNSSIQISTRSFMGSTASTGSTTSLIRSSVALVSKHLTSQSPGMQDRGYPGELTEVELETCLAFREELKKRDPAFKQMVMAMHPYEKEAFSLCRFLRARDFDMENVLTMMHEKNQLENWHAVKRRDPNIFKDFHETIPEYNGCPLSVFLTQYPMIFSGIGKNGAIVGYFKAGRVSCPGIECIVGDLVNAIPFSWNMCYNAPRNAMEREIARSDAATTTVLAEQIIVGDLEGDSSLFTSGLPLLRAAPTASACFPESINRTYVLNAPYSFSMVWAVIRKMIDPRTVKKVGFFSTIPKAKKDFLEHIDSDELLSCYGGTGQSFDDVFAVRQRENAHKEGVVRYVVELLTMSGREVGFDFDLSSNESVDSIVIYSRSDNMCEISVVDGKRNCIVDGRNVSREQATSKASCPADAPSGGKSHNNYAVEIATSEDFAADAAGPFFVNTKSGTKGDYFLVAISIAEK